MDAETTIEQDLEEILNKFKQQRAQLQDRVKSDTTKIERLTRTIDALEMPPGTEAPMPTGPAVIDMAQAAIDQMHNGTTLDAQSLRDKMITLYPDAAVRIKKGVYAATATLQRRNKIQRVPGGFQVIRPVAGPPS